MKKRIQSDVFKAIVMLFVGIAVVSCEKEETFNTAPEDQTIQELPSSQFISLEEVKEMTEEIIDGELGFFEPGAKSVSDAKKTSEILEYTFAAEVTKGPASGAQLAGDLKIKLTKFYRGFSIFRGVLNLPDGKKTRVRGAVTDDDMVYLLTYIRGIGYIYGVGMIADNGAIAGPFHLYSNSGKSEGTWTATPGNALPSIVDLAIATPELSTLVGALQAADLVGALQGEGPFTVFAPVNAAFEMLDAIPEGEALKEVLLYHVASGMFDSASLIEKKTVTTLQGDEVTIEANGAGEVILNGAVKVAIADIKASNGIVHVITGVLLPPTPELKSIVELALETPELSTLVGALQAADLVGALQGEGPFTVFAPTNDAFAALDAVPDGELLKKVLLHHVTPGNIVLGDIKTGVNVFRALDGEAVVVRYEVPIKDFVISKDIMFVIKDIKASNGIVHVIDQVIIPPSLR